MDFSFKCCVVLAIVSLVNCGLNNDEYHEELYLKPLNGYVYAYFQFTTIWETSIRNDTFDNCHLFPRPMGEILQRHNVQELHISLTKGLWRYQTWGYPAVSAPPGAELWAWFKPGTTDIDAKWKELTGALSGLLCSSLNFIDGQNTMSPELSLRPLGVSDTNDGEPVLKYSTLPREIVCTENLTPWKKLLPCNLKRGLSAILNSDHIYNTVYHSLGIHFRPICLDNGCKRTAVELKQTVSLVYDLIIVSRTPSYWSIQTLFGQGLVKTCALAKSSNIYIDVTSNKTDNAFSLKPQKYTTIVSTRGAQTSTYAVFNMEQLNYLLLYNIEINYLKEKMYPVNIPPVIYANRYITGYGQEFGGITTKIHNRHFQPIQVLFLENIPWFVPIYFHTLKVESGGKLIQPIMKKYYPGKERVRPYYMELLVELPARSVTFISIEFDYAFLRWQEYPPDANHGFYMGAAMITAMLPLAKNYTSPPRDKSLFISGVNASRMSYPIRVTTEVLIISLPTPDFSMPYNVICLACTVVALAFGPLHNITTKKFVVVKSTTKKGLIRVVFFMLFDRLQKMIKNGYNQYKESRAKAKLLKTKKLGITIEDENGDESDSHSDDEDENQKDSELEDFSKDEDEEEDEEEEQEIVQKCIKRTVKSSS